MRRREFITLLGVAAVAWPLAARAQQRERMRRIGVLVGNLPAGDPEWQARSNAFVQGLQERGWSDGRNLRIEYRWGLGDPDRLRKYVAELVALANVILAAGAPAVAALQPIKPFGAHRVRECSGPSGRRLCRHLGAAGRQRHRLRKYRIWHEREMARVAQAGCTARGASGSRSESRQSV